MRQRSGVALVTVLLLISLVIMGIAAVGARTRMGLRSGTHQEQKLQTTYAAQAGLARALNQLSRDPHWQPPGAYTGTLSGSTGFEVQCSNNFGGLTPLASAGDRPPVPPHRVWLRSSGTLNGRPLAGGFGQAEAFGAQPEPLFKHALHCAGNPLQLNNGGGQTRVDSYLPASPLTSATTRAASVRADGGLDVRGCRVDGDVVLPGPDASLQSNAGDYTGARVDDDTPQLPWIFRKPRSFEGLPLRSQWSYYGVGTTSTGLGPNGGSLPPGPYGDIFTDSSASGNLKMLPGVYYVRGNYEIGLNSEILLDDSVTPDHPCIVYVGSQLIFEGGTRIATRPLGAQAEPDPRRLQFYLCDEMYGASSVAVGPGVEACCTVAGQHARVSLDTSVTWYGALVFESLTLLNNCAFQLHYSRDLAGNKCDGEPEWVLVNQGHT